MMQQWADYLDKLKVGEGYRCTATRHNGLGVSDRTLHTDPILPSEDLRAFRERQHYQRSLTTNARRTTRTNAVNQQFQPQLP